MKRDEAPDGITIPALHTARAIEFPVVAESAYFAHAAVAPLPACVRGAMKEYIDRAAIRGQFDWLIPEVEIETRTMIAGLLDVSATEIAFASSTSAALGTVASGIRWKRGDNVVATSGDFPSNVWPWAALSDQGVELRLIATGSEPLKIEDIAPYLDSRTRLVALSSVHYVSGRPVQDLCEIGNYLRSLGILTCVDAIQSLGARPTCGRCVDFLAADGHKWLLAPKGMAVLYMRKAAMEEMHTPIVGWRSAARVGDFSSKICLSADARRYEPGSLNEIGLVGLHSALKLLTALGAVSIEGEICRLRRHFVAGVRDLGGSVIGRPEDPDWGGIAAFTLPNLPARSLEIRLRESMIIVSRRTHIERGHSHDVLRFAPHFYNSVEEVDRLLFELRDAIRDGC